MQLPGAPLKISPMKPSPFSYHRVTQLAEVFPLLSLHGSNAKLLAGGQSLIPMLNLRLSQPELLVDISRLSELRGIRLEGEVLKVGALTRHVEIERSPEVARLFPTLIQAVREIAHPAIRNRGTIGGSLALADPAAEWPAAALAFNMTFELASARGMRQVKATDFFKGLYDTALAADEVLVAIYIPASRATSRAAFGELARRSGDYAIAGAFVNAERSSGENGGRLQHMRIAYFGVAGVPVLARRTMAALDGTIGDAAAIEAAAQHLEADLDPLADLYNKRATKLHLSRVLLKRLVASLGA